MAQSGVPKTPRGIGRISNPYSFGRTTGIPQKMQHNYLRPNHSFKLTPLSGAGGLQDYEN